jgi:hypothetical protein
VHGGLPSFPEAEAGRGWNRPSGRQRGRELREAERRRNRLSFRQRGLASASSYARPGDAGTG